MAIRTVVTRGYGNGTFNGTIGLVTLRGYQSSQAAPAVGGPYCVIAMQLFGPGAVADEVFVPGNNGKEQVFNPGTTPKTTEVC
jgi:hypothetical protein